MTTIAGQRSLHLALALVFATLTGCAGGPPGGEVRSRSPRGIVVVSVEGWWAPSEDAGISAFDGVLEGVKRVPDAMTPSPQPRPAVAAALSGLGPDRLGMIRDDRAALPSSAPWTPELLQRAGWATGAFVSSTELASGDGLERGFDVFDAPDAFLIGPLRHLPRPRDPAVAVEDFHEWRRGLDAGRDLFAWLDVSGNGWYGRERGRAEAAAEIAKLRQALLGIVAGGEGIGSDASRSWTVVFFGTAGKIDPDDGRSSGYFLEPEVLRVPLAVWSSSVTAPGEIDRPVWLPDVSAIVAEAAGIKAEGEEAIAPEATRIDRPRFAWTSRAAEDFGWPSEAAVLQRGVLVVRPWPGGAVRRVPWDAAAHPDADVDAALQALASRAEPASEGSAPPAIPDDVLAGLAAHGVRVPPMPASSTGASLEARRESIATLTAARRLARIPAPRQAMREFDLAAKLDPTNPAPLVEAGCILALMQMPKRAQPRLEAALAIRPYDAEAWHWLGHVAIVLKDVPKAEAIWRMSEALDPREPDLLYDLACARSLSGDPEGSVEYLRRAWDAGFRKVEDIQNDPDLRNLRADPRFANFMQQVVR